MSTDSFFDETNEQSVVKTEIVSKYFWAWAKVIIPSAKKSSRRIAYIDLFAGPGRYKDGTSSTPLLVLKQAIQDEDLRQMLVTIFNDKDQNNSQSLQKAIDEIPGITTLKYKPVVNNSEVGDEIAKMFQQMRVVPTFFFVDPWGYKGLSLGLVYSILKDWGCDCVFFFNYNRINMGLNNPIVKTHMEALFGKQRANELRAKLEPLSPMQRELTIVEELCEALKEIGGKYVLPFCFKNDSGNRTSHHLIFVSKHFRGYEIMKGIMAKESTNTTQGVPSFVYSPADNRQPILFELSRPLYDLECLLLEEYAGRTLSMQEIYESHNVGRRYIEKNYKDVLKKMEQEGKIIADPPEKSRRKDTFGSSVKVTFP